MKSLKQYIIEAKSSEPITLDNLKKVLSKINSVKKFNDFDDRMGEFLKSEGCEALDSINPDKDDFCSITAEMNNGRGPKDKIVRSFSFYDAKSGKYGYCHYLSNYGKIVGQFKEKAEYKKVVPDFYLGINKYNAEYLYKVPQDLFDKIIDILLPFISTDI